MRSTDGRRHRQRGGTLIEAVVAAALLGIVGMVGVTAWDTAIMSAKRAVRQAWAECLVRSELDAVLAAPWAEPSAGYPVPDPSLMRLQVTFARPTSGQGEEEGILVKVIDPQSGDVLYQGAALKVLALQGNKPMTASGVLTDIAYGCPAP
jgi:type II secretory pathway pseudopilin PulG